MKQVKLFSVILLAMFVTACGNDPQDANEENFEIAINRILAQDPLCITNKDFKRLRYTVPFAFPWTYNPNRRDYARGYVAGAIEALDMFTDVGLLEKNEDVMVPTYDLTDRGQEIFRDNGFCYGIKQVVAITNYTEPNAQMGHSAVQVQYSFTKKITDDWVRNDAFKDWVNKVEQSVVAPEKGSVTLVLTKKGWFSPWELR